MDYKERLIKEHSELLEKLSKLHSMNAKIKAGTLGSKLVCPAELLQEQEDVMTKYLEILEVRAEVENIKLR